MKLIFMGTPDFAVPCLERLIDAGHEIAAVFTQPDKPRGRKQELTPPEVKVCAVHHDLPVYQPNTLRNGEAMKIIESIRPDCIVVAAYGKILPKEMLDFPIYGCINVHASLLPKYRGSAPIQWSVINGDMETGVTIMQMAEGVDTGDMLYQKAIPIGIDDTAESMFDKLSYLGGEMIVEALSLLEQGKLTPEKQDEALATHAPMLNKEISVIDWHKPALEVHNLVRGLYSWPIAQTTLHGKKLKIYRTSVGKGSGEAGCVIDTAPLTVACSDGAVVIEELQLEGKKRMDVKTFLIGHPLQLKEKLGD
ncbi:MAG: methionyl-tRNA formyltransferase [Ruminococcus sp.]|uniref:methionyl-tRNA formyltransferase n=1 Tax=Ruminococcus sp. TaxID=41978 RepID=UPI002873D900|nr:methionyl-tRNA formyltransferase [Ruminococcus sp.]MBQ3285954.1 methionyl-tRNA formyltransferase [Ruminococcus sp.]